MKFRTAIPAFASVITVIILQSYAESETVNPVPVINDGHHDCIYNSEFSSSGKILVTRENDRLIKMWDTAGGRLIRSVYGEKIELSPDGQYAVVQTPQWYQIVIRDMEKWGRVKEFTGADPVFSPDGKFMVFRDSDNYYIVETFGWSITTTIREDSDSFSDMVISPDSRQLLTVRVNRAVLRDLKNGKVTGTITTGKSQAVVWYSADGRTLISEDASSVKLWDSRTCRKAAVLISDNEDIICETNGTIIAIALAGKNLISIYNATTGNKLNEIEEKDGHIKKMCLSPDGTVIAEELDQVSNASGAMVRLRDVVSGKILSTFRGYMGDGTMFSPDSRIIVVRNMGVSISFIDVNTGKNIGSIDTELLFPGSVSFSADSRFIAAGRIDGSVLLWEVPAGRNVPGTRLKYRHRGGADSVNSVALSPDGRYLATGNGDWNAERWDYSDNNTVRVWDLQQGKVVKVFDDQEVISRCVAFSPDGKHLASGGKDNIILRDTVKWKAVKTIRAEGKPQHVFSSDEYKFNVTSLFFSMNSGAIAYECNRNVYVYEIETGRHEKSELFISEGSRYALSGYDMAVWARERDPVVLYDIKLSADLSLLDRNRWKERTSFYSSGRVESVAFSPDGRIVAVAASNLLTLRDSVNGEEIMEIPAHDDVVKSICFSANGRILVSCGLDNTIKFRDVADGRLLATCATFGNGYIVITPDGRYSGNDDGLEMLQLVSGTDIFSTDVKKDRSADNLLALVVKDYITSGKIEFAGKIGQTGKEIIINHPDTGKMYNNGDTLFVMVNGEKIVLTVKSGMRTVTKCKAASETDAATLQKGMAVFRDVR